MPRTLGDILPTTSFINVLVDLAEDKAVTSPLTDREVAERHKKFWETNFTVENLMRLYRSLKPNLEVFLREIRLQDRIKIAFLTQHDVSLEFQKLIMSNTTAEVKKSKVLRKKVLMKSHTSQSLRKPISSQESFVKVEVDDQPGNLFAESSERLGSVGDSEEPSGSVTPFDSPGPAPPADGLRLGRESVERSTITVTRIKSEYGTWAEPSGSYDDPGELSESLTPPSTASPDDMPRLKPETPLKMVTAIKREQDYEDESSFAETEIQKTPSEVLRALETDDVRLIETINVAGSFGQSSSEPLSADEPHPPYETIFSSFPSSSLNYEETWYTSEIISLLKFVRIQCISHAYTFQSLWTLCKKFKSSKDMIYSNEEVLIKAQQLLTFQTLDMFQYKTRVIILYYLRIPIQDSLIPELSSQFEIKLDPTSRIRYCKDKTGSWRIGWQDIDCPVMSCQYQDDLMSFLAKCAENSESPKSYERLANVYLQFTNTEQDLLSLTRQFACLKHAILKSTDFDVLTQIRIIFMCQIKTPKQFRMSIKSQGTFVFDDGRIKSFVSNDGKLVLQREQERAQVSKTKFLENHEVSSDRTPFDAVIVYAPLPTPDELELQEAARMKKEEQNRQRRKRTAEVKRNGSFMSKGLLNENVEVLDESMVFQDGQPFEIRTPSLHKRSFEPRCSEPSTSAPSLARQSGLSTLSQLTPETGHFSHGVAQIDASSLLPFSMNSLLTSGSTSTVIDSDLYETVASEPLYHKITHTNEPTNKCLPNQSDPRTSTLKETLKLLRHQPGVVKDAYSITSVPNDSSSAKMTKTKIRAPKESFSLEYQLKRPMSAGTDHLPTKQVKLNGSKSLSSFGTSLASVLWAPMISAMSATLPPNLSVHSNAVLSAESSTPLVAVQVSPISDSNLERAPHSAYEPNTSQPLLPTECSIQPPREIKQESLESTEVLETPRKFSDLDLTIPESTSSAGEITVKDTGMRAVKQEPLEEYQPSDFDTRVSSVSTSPVEERPEKRMTIKAEPKSPSGIPLEPASSTPGVYYAAVFEIPSKNQADDSQAKLDCPMHQHDLMKPSTSARMKPANLVPRSPTSPPPPTMVSPSPTASFLPNFVPQSPTTPSGPFQSHYQLSRPMEPVYSYSTQRFYRHIAYVSRTWATHPTLKEIDDAIRRKMDTLQSGEAIPLAYICSSLKSSLQVVSENMTVGLDAKTSLGFSRMMSFFLNILNSIKCPMLKELKSEMLSFQRKNGSSGYRIPVEIVANVIKSIVEL